MKYSILVLIFILAFPNPCKAERDPGSKLKRRVPTATRVPNPTPANTAVNTATPSFTPTPTDTTNLSGTSIKVVASDTTASTSPTVQLTDFNLTIAANEIWIIEYHLVTNSTTAAGIKFQGGTLQTGGYNEGQLLCSQGSTGLGYREERFSGSPSVAFGGACNVWIGDGIANIYVFAKAGSSGSVTYQLGFAKITSGTATVYANSYMYARKLV